jgi:hypothetical protein
MAAKHRRAGVFDLLALASASLDIPVFCAIRATDSPRHEQRCAATPG